MHQSNLFGHRPEQAPPARHRSATSRTEQTRRFGIMAGTGVGERLMDVTRLLALVQLDLRPGFRSDIKSLVL